MGDFCAPKRKEVFDKIRRRLQIYRNRQSDSASRYFDSQPSILEQNKQSTLLLRQRWLDSKAKKAAKQSKTNRDSNSFQSDHRNLVVTKLKRKIDSIGSEANTSSTAPSTITTAAETVFSFEDNEQQSSKKGKTSNSKSNGIGGGSKHASGLPSLSVQIVQQISGRSQQDTPQTIHTNVTVSSCYSTDSPNAGTKSHSVHTSVQCKQEPSEDIGRPSTTSTTSLPTVHNNNIESSSVGDIGIGIDDVDELQNILDSIEKDDEIESSLLKELHAFNEICEKVQRDSESNESASMYGPLSSGSPGLLKGVFSSLGTCSQVGNMFDSSQNINSAAMTNHTIPVPSAIPEPTGPAAETLKQMAAQHQHQHSPGYPMKSIDHYSDGLHNGGFSPNYPPMYRSVPNMPSFPFNQSSNHHLNETSQMTPEIVAAMTYGGTKPLTHFPNEQGQQHNSSSSLQQLQNQVQSQFKPSMTAPHQMQITQTQHMQLTHGSHNMQMSQSQQIQMQPSPQQISLSQHQSFTIGQQQMVNEQMKMQMMEKLRMEQQQQQQNCLPPQYMARPPPDYNMHHISRSQGPYPNSMCSSSSQNPLQTIQNMVNQTSAYGVIKSEVAGAASPGQPSSGMISSQISAMQQQTISATMASNGPHMGNLSQPSQSARASCLPQQHMQQPPGYHANESSIHTQSSSTYTSAIMRNQRPPNVNVGPDGLNISQSRPNSDWSQTNVMQPGHTGVRTGILSSGPSPHGTGILNNGPSPHGMSQSAAMSAHMMQYQQHRPPHYGASPNAGNMTLAATTTSSLSQVQQQQGRQAVPSHMRSGLNTSMVPNGSQMMMQHQGMQVSQQMSMQTSNSVYSIGGPTVGSVSMPTSGYNMAAAATLNNSGVSNPQTNGSQPASFSNQPPAAMSSQDEFLHFLDNPLSSEPMFDSLHQSTPDDFSLFEDIFNGK